MAKLDYEHGKFFDVFVNRHFQLGDMGDEFGLAKASIDHFEASSFFEFV